MRLALQPLVDALTRVVLAHAVLHADENPVQMLKPGSARRIPMTGLRQPVFWSAARCGLRFLYQPGRSACA